MGASKHANSNAFCLLTFICESCDFAMEVYNSRDGKIMNPIGCPHCKTRTMNLDDNQTKYKPDLKMRPGQLLFVDCTEDDAEYLASLLPKGTDQQTVEYLKESAYGKGREPIMKIWKNGMPSLIG